MIMKKYAADLHIHTCLSPCSDNDMTPANILNMAKLAGLDMVGITDHNSAENIKAFLEAAHDYDILVIPGMEVNTREEVHVLCYFQDMDGIMEWQEVIYKHLPPIKNNKDIFGDQLVVDFMGRVIREEERFLLSAVDLSFDEIVKQVTNLGGICIPSHIDRPHNSLIYNLGLIPEDAGICAVEISKNTLYEEVIKEIPVLKEFTVIQSSDAHSLGEILDRRTYFLLEDLTFKEFTLALKRIKGRKVILEI